MNYSNRLRRLRLDKGWTQEDMAKFAGVTAASISTYENGNKPLSIKLVRKFSEFFGIDPLEIYSSADPDFEPFGFRVTDVGIPPNNIKAFRLRKFFTQSDLAKVMRIDVSYVCTNESLKRRISKSLLAMYCNSLDTTPLKLVQHKGDNNWKKLEIPNIPRKLFLQRREVKEEIIPLVLNSVPQAS